MTPVKLLAAATLLSPLLTGCLMTGSGGTDGRMLTAAAAYGAGGVVPCEVLSPIKWSARDTRETQNQVVEFNAVGARVCEWKRK